MKKKITKEEKALSLWKIKTTPPDWVLHIGDHGSFTIEELEKHVEAEDEIGILFCDMQMAFMKDLMSGKVSKFLAE